MTNALNYKNMQHPKAPKYSLLYTLLRYDFMFLYVYLRSEYHILIQSFMSADDTDLASDHFDCPVRTLRFFSFFLLPSFLKILQLVGVAIMFLLLFLLHQLLMSDRMESMNWCRFICGKPYGTLFLIKTDRFYDKVKSGVEGLMSLTGFADSSGDDPRCFVNFNQDFTWAVAISTA